MSASIRGLTLSLGLSDDGYRLFCLCDVPLSGAQVMARHSDVVVLQTPRRVGEISGDVIHRSIRRAQLFHFAFLAWGEAYRRHLANVARQFSFGNNFLVRTSSQRFHSSGKV